MESRTEDCIVMLPTHNRCGSFKMMSLTSGRIVTRDQFKILPMPQSVIQTLNSWAIKEGKKITRTQVHVFDKMLFDNSLDKSDMPTFITNPPTQDGDVDKARGIQPPTTQPQPVIADLPQADNVIELPHYEVGGMAPGVLELGIMEPQVESVAYPTKMPVVLTHISHPPRGTVTASDRDQHFPPNSTTPY